MPPPDPGPESSAASPSEDLSPRWISVARLLRPQGRRGEILADPLTDLPEVFATGRHFRIASSPDAVASAGSITLEACWRPQGRSAGRLVLKLQGIDSISAAEALETKHLLLAKSDLPALPADTYLVRDLVGCSLFDGNDLLGTITDLQFPIAADGRTRIADAADLLVVEPATAPPGSDPVLVPFVNAWLISVDVPKKRIHMKLPPGLIAPPETP